MAFKRQIAQRVFGFEWHDAGEFTTEGEGKFISSVVVTKTGRRISRLFLIGTLLSVENIGTDGNDYYRVTVSDGTDNFEFYASPAWQPQEVAALKTLEAPSFVAVVGRAKVLTSDDTGEQRKVLKLEHIAKSTKEQRNYWEYEAATQTFDTIMGCSDPETKRYLPQLISVLDTVTA
jgi:RPA family protein